MWADKAVFYQIYPLGFTGAPMPNDGVCVNRIQKVKGWIPHLKKLHIGAVYFSPVFESDNHGYDTRDFTKIAMRCTKTVSKLCLTACSTTWAAAFLRSVTCRRKSGTLPIKTGFT